MVVFSILYFKELLGLVFETWYSAAVELEYIGKKNVRLSIWYKTGMAEFMSSFQDELTARLKMMGMKQVQ